MDNVEDNKILYNLYELYSSYMCKPSKEYEKILHNFNVRMEETTVFDAAAKTELEELLGIYKDMMSESNRQYFLAGYSLAVKSIIEGLSI